MSTTLFKIVLVLTFLVIEYLALTPQHIEVIEGLWDKQNHFIAFLVLYVLLSIAYERLTTLKKIGMLVFVGFQIEITQYFIPGRFFSLMDIVADSIGIAMGIALYRLFNGVRQIKGKRQ